MNDKTEPSLPSASGTTPSAGEATAADSPPERVRKRRPLPGEPGAHWPVELAAYDEETLLRSLPAIEDAPPLSLRDDIEDFRVDEVPSYEPGGEGEHLYLHVEKRGVSTPEVVKRIGRALGLKDRDIGFAGRKDQRGVTTQWLSFPHIKAKAKWGDEVAADVLGEGITVLTARPHKNKLRLGHLAGNRFHLVLRPETDGGLEHLPAFVETLRERATTLERFGYPAYFGAQRFGHDSQSLRQAERFLAGGRAARSRKEMFFVSIVQSALFNRWLTQRVGDELWLKAVEGDVMLTRKGGPFWCEDAVLDSARVFDGEVSPSGPMFGRKMRAVREASLTRESRSLTDVGIEPSIFETHPAFSSGERRPTRGFPNEIQVTLLDGGIRAEFTLPPGAYATVFIRELVGSRVRDGAFFDA